MNFNRRFLIHGCGATLLAAAATWITAPAAPARHELRTPTGTRHAADPAFRTAAAVTRATPVEPVPESQAAVAAFRAAGGSVTITDDGQVRAVNLTGTEITDDDLQQLAAVTQITLLNLDGTRITDNGLRHLHDLPELSILRLCRTSVTDAGLNTLKDLPKLSTLLLDDTAVTDEGIINLARLPTLGFITVMGCPVTDRAQEQLREHLPKCRVKR